MSWQAKNLIHNTVILSHLSIVLRFSQSFYTLQTLLHFLLEPQGDRSAAFKDTVFQARKKNGKLKKNFQQMLINHTESVPKSPPLSAVLETANLALSFIEGPPGLWTDGFKNSGRGCWV